jgi:sterol desaturase/sphingolipid hydroxylase (fatty acid hydroxylase superfamily)
MQIEGESSRPSARGSDWLWLPVLAIGLAAVLAGPSPTAAAAEIARPAAERIVHGDFAVGRTELAAIAAVAGWLVAKQLAVIGALLWLELRFRTDRGDSRYLLAWIVRASSIVLVIGLTVLLKLLGLMPKPLIDVGEASGIGTLFLILLPAFLLNLFVLDFFHYWTHRAFHHFPALWRLHAVHHSLDIGVLHNVSHPIEDVLATLWVAIPSALLVGVSDGQIFLLVAFTSIHSHINHTRMPIHLGPLGKWLLSDNRYHFLHHSIDPAHHNRNFAERFPVLDMMFGTHAHSATRTDEVGLADRLPPQTLGEFLTADLQPRARAQG